MEVHHHPDLHHEKKKWKEYFLEFIIIFLAVTLGFIAESLRESISEHERAKVFAASMLKDLGEDTTQLKPYRAYFDYAASNVDTLIQMLGSTELNDIPTGKLYWYGLWGGAHRFFIPNDATFQQMKSSGSLRYFDKTIAYDAAAYDRLCRMMQTTEASLSHDKTLFNQYVEWVRSRFMHNNVVLADSLLSQSKKLIRELQSKYGGGVTD